MSAIFDPDDFINKAKQLEANTKKRTLLFLSTIVILVLAFIFYSVISVKKSNEEVIEVTTKITNNLNREDSAKNIIYDFFKFQNSNDSSGIIKLLSDTIFRYYYIYKPILAKNIRSNKDFLVNQKGKYRIDSSFQMSNKDDTLIANVISPIYDGNKTPLKRFHIIKLNSSLKIIYVRAFIIDDI